MCWKHKNIICSKHTNIICPTTKISLAHKNHLHTKIICSTHKKMNKHSAKSNVSSFLINIDTKPLLLHSNYGFALLWHKLWILRLFLKPEFINADSTLLWHGVWKRLWRPWLLLGRRLCPKKSHRGWVVISKLSFIKYISIECERESGLNFFSKGICQHLNYQSHQNI